MWRWNNDDPFGANMASENPSGLGTFTFNLRFPGQYFDKETNQHYNYYRDYSPEIGRYIQSDPIGLTGGINTYGYVESDPIGKIDPTGLRDDSFPGGGGQSTAGPFWSPVQQANASIARGLTNLINKIVSACTSGGGACPPCTPYGVGTIGFQGPEVGVQGRDAGIPHYWFYQVEQIPSTCECIWKERTKALVGAHHYYDQPNPAMSVNLNGSGRPPNYPQ